MRELYATIVRVGASEASVLVHGETGTGKELVARAIHDCSHRAGKPFVVIDCAALPESLLEGELFGHARGAFTGAVSARIGSFEAAEGGTVFLDEIGELPLATQPKLLRVLESRSVRRVGETNQRPIQARFLAATHRDLRRMVNAGQFREDLYFRVAVLPVRVPRSASAPRISRVWWSVSLRRCSLKRRAELFAAARGRRLAGERARAAGTSSSGAMLLGAPTRTIDRRPADEPSGGRRSARRAPVRCPSKISSAPPSAEYLRLALERHGGQVADAAEASGINRTYFYRLLKKYAL